MPENVKWALMSWCSTPPDFPPRGQGSWVFFHIYRCLLLSSLILLHLGLCPLREEPALASRENSQKLALARPEGSGGVPTRSPMSRQKRPWVLIRRRQVWLTNGHSCVWPSRIAKSVGLTFRLDFIGCLIFAIKFCHIHSSYGVWGNKRKKGHFLADRKSGKE